MGRQRYLLSWAAVGAVAALLVYGFGVRALGLNHGLRSVYTIVAAVLLVLSRRLVRGLESSERPRMHWLAVAVVLGAAVASAASLAIDPPPSLRRFERHELPGFTIELPTGTQKPMAQAYSSGMYAVSLDANALAIVGWTPGTGSREELEKMAEGAKATVATLVSGSRIVTIADRDSAVVDFKDGRRLLYTTVGCDGRVVFVETIGLAEATHARIVRSFVCAPAPHAPEEVPITFDTTGLKLVENKDAHIYYADEGKTVVGAAMMPTVLDAGTFRTMLANLLANEGLTGVELQPQAPDLIGFTGSIRGAAGTGTVRNVVCGVRSVLVIGFAIDPAAASTVAQTVNAAHCK